MGLDLDWLNDDDELELLKKRQDNVAAIEKVETKEVKNVLPGNKQSVNEEYDRLASMIPEKSNVPKRLNKRDLFIDRTKEKKPVLVLSREELDRIKYPIKKSKVTVIEEIEVDEDDFLFHDGNIEKVASIDNRVGNGDFEYKDIIRDSILIDKIVNQPRVYIRFNIDTRIAYREEQFLDVSGYDCVIDMDGTTIWDKLSNKKYHPRKYTDRVEKALMLTRHGNVHEKDLIKGYKTKDMGMWGKLEIPKDERFIAERIPMRAEAFDKKQLISKKIGLDVKSLNNLFKIPGKNDNHIYGLDKRVNKYYNIGGEEIIRLDDEDRDILFFISKFKFSVNSILKNLHGRDDSEIALRLERLRKLTLIKSVIYKGIGSIWVLDNLGLDLTKSKLGNGLPKLGSISQKLGAQYVASYLWNSRANVLNLPDYIKGKQEFIVSETEIQSSFIKEMNPFDSPIQPYAGYSTEKVANAKRRYFMEWDEMFKVDKSVPSPDFVDGLEFTWVVFPTVSLSKELKRTPDLVLKRERLSDGSPQSIAIEVERKQATIEDYKNILEFYKQDRRNYKEVVWITSSSAIANKIQAGAKEAGFTDYRIVPFINEKGTINLTDFWKITDM